MKFFATVLTVYILLLSMFPCPEDVFPLAKEIKTAAVEQTPADDNCEDDCPPFCDCACCAVLLFRNCHCIKIKPPLPVVIHHPVISNLQLFDIYRPIWQPPQLS